MTTTILFVSFSLNVYSQNEKADKTKMVIGVSAPELLHAGATYRITNSSLIGGSLGIGPSLGTTWTSVSLEHRLYLGKNSAKTNQKIWFFRQE